MNTSQPSSKPSTPWLNILTWLVILLASDLLSAIWQALAGEVPGWLFWAKATVLFLLILISLVWEPIRPVRLFFALLLVLMLALWGVSWLRETAAYKQWEAGANWVVAMAAFQAQKFAVALIMVVVLLVVGRRMRDFFFTPGQLNAPIKALNPSKPQARRLISWRTLGLLLGLCIAPLTLLVFGVGNLPSASALSKALPFLPAALIFAATNAFSEETQYRAALLGDLHRLFGDEQAIWMTAIFFGFAHYFGGAPSGVPGVLITGLLGALFAKCMLDSKGILVPWFIHFCQNSVIYAFWAFGAMNA